MIVSYNSNLENKLNNHTFHGNKSLQFFVVWWVMERAKPKKIRARRILSSFTQPCRWHDLRWPSIAKAYFWLCSVNYLLMALHGPKTTFEGKLPA